MIYIFSFIFWIIFGSFISVLVYRIKNQESGIFLWRSKCPYCKHTLSTFDLVPIFSYIFLKWKCRYCQKKISIIYPILELVTWILFVLSSLFLIKYFWENYIYNHIFIIIYLWLIVVFVVALGFYDILFYEISFILASILWVLLILPQLFWYIWDWKLAIILWLIWFLVFMTIIYLRKFFRKIDWMWWWDAIWIILVWLSMPMILEILQINDIWFSFYITILLWFISAGLIWIIYIILWKWSKFALPFLPFMFIWIILFIIFWKYLINFIN